MAKYRVIEEIYTSDATKFTVQSNLGFVDMWIWRFDSSYDEANEATEAMLKLKKCRDTKIKVIARA